MQVQITPADVLESTKVDLMPRRGVTIAASVVLLLVFLLSIVAISRKPDCDVCIQITAILLILLPFLPFWYWFLLPRRVNKLHRQQRSLHEPFDFEIVENGLHFTSVLGSGVLPWDQILRWRETENLFLIDHSGSMRNVLPKRSFDSPQELEAFRVLLEEHVGPVNAKREDE